MASSALDEKRKQRQRERKKAAKAKKRRRLLLKLLRDLVLIALIAVISINGYHFFYAVFADEAVAASEEEGQDITVRVDSGMSDLQVGKMLKQNGLVENAYVFFAQTKIFSDSGSSIQPGTYQLNTSMNAQDMLEILTAVSEDASGDASD